MILTEKFLVVKLAKQLLGNFFLEKVVNGTVMNLQKQFSLSINKQYT